MTRLIINCITDFSIESLLVESENFDNVFGKCQKSINNTFSAIEPSFTLETIYIQFQLLPGKNKNSESKFRIGRYSTKNKDFQAYVKIGTNDFPVFRNEANTKSYIYSNLIELLNKIEVKYKNKLNSNINKIITSLQIEI